MYLVIKRNIVFINEFFTVFSILLHTGEELGMKKDRLLLLDETIVPASMTQLREVHVALTY